MQRGVPTGPATRRHVELEPRVPERFHSAWRVADTLIFVGIPAASLLCVAAIVGLAYLQALGLAVEPAATIAWLLAAVVGQLLAVVGFLAGILWGRSAQ